MFVLTMKTLIVIILFILYAISFSSGSPVYNSLVLEGEHIKTVCAVKKCIRKCCQKNQYVNFNSACENFDTDFYTKFYDFSSIPVYNENNLEQKINRSVRDLFYLVPGRFDEILMEEEFSNSTFKVPAFVATDYGMNNVLSEVSINLHIIMLVLCHCLRCDRSSIRFPFSCNYYSK